MYVRMYVVCMHTYIHVLKYYLMHYITHCCSDGEGLR